jgi:hypothetical protein
VDSMQCFSPSALEGGAIRAFDGGGDVVVDIDGRHLPWSVRHGRALVADNVIGEHVRAKYTWGQLGAPIDECLHNVAAGFSGGAEVTRALCPPHL